MAKNRIQSRLAYCFASCRRPTLQRSICQSRRGSFLVRRVESQMPVAPGGYLVLSGILDCQASEVARRFSAGRFTLLRQSRDKEWVTLLLKNKS